MPHVLFRQLWGSSKRADLLESLESGLPAYKALQPAAQIGYPFGPASVAATYLAWPSLPELLPVSFPGVKTSRDGFVVDIDRDRLVDRMGMYFDPKITHDEMLLVCPSAVTDASRFEAITTREYLRERGFLPEKVVRYCYRPFDERWIYWEPETKLLDERRAEYFPHVFPGNISLCAVQQNRKGFDPPFPSRYLCSLHLIERGASIFPLLLNSSASNAGLFVTESQGAPKANLSDSCAVYLGQMGYGNPASGAEDVFFHILGVLSAPGYARENSGALRMDWPRIPLPKTRQALKASAELGGRVAALLDTESGVRGVTSGTLEGVFRTIGVLTKVGSCGPAALGWEDAITAGGGCATSAEGDANTAGGGCATSAEGDANTAGGGCATSWPGGNSATQLDPDAGDLAVTVGWGHGGKGGVTMPGKGRIVARPYEKVELAAIADAAKARGLSVRRVLAILGEDTRDVYLNDQAYWKNVPAGVWEYYIGGYQVVKKWLSYREEKLLGRALSADEAREVTNMARRLAAIILLQPALDDNYRRVAGDAYRWPADHA